MTSRSGFSLILILLLLLCTVGCSTPEQRREQAFQVVDYAAANGNLDHQNKGQLAAAIEVDFLNRFPNHAGRHEILVAMARRAVRTGRHQEALRLANESLQLDPGSAGALVEKGRALQGLGQHQKARQVFELVLDSKPDNAIAMRLVEQEQRREEPALVDLQLTARSQRSQE